MTKLAHSIDKPTLPAVTPIDKRYDVRQESHGTLLISLDLELYWGVRDNRSIEAYQENLQGVRDAIKRILATFQEYDIHATWATVGLLFLDNESEIERDRPQTLPNYVDDRLSPYQYIRQSDQIRKDLHFAPDVIASIQQVQGQEIGSHTFSHYYCLEPGQTRENFHDDLVAAKMVASRRGIELKSVVFPRNQINPAYLSELASLGMLCYRGLQSGLVYADNSSANRNSLWRRFARFADSYINITGHNAFSPSSAFTKAPLNLPASCFLRPYSGRLAFADPLKLRRITRSMEYAAKHGLTYHLWWHPHNFGKNIEKNIDFFRRIAERYLELRRSYGMVSLNMGEIATQLLERSNDHF